MLNHRRGAGGGVDFYSLFGLNPQQAAAAQSLVGTINPDTKRAFTPFEAAAGIAITFETGPFASKPPPGGAFAPPAFASTQAGISFQAAQDRAYAAQGDSASMERLKFQEAEAWRRGEFA